MGYITTVCLQCGESPKDGALKGGILSEDAILNWKLMKQEHSRQKESQQKELWRNMTFANFRMAVHKLRVWRDTSGY